MATEHTEPTVQRFDNSEESIKYYFNQYFVNGTEENKNIGKKIIAAWQQQHPSEEFNKKEGYEILAKVVPYSIFCGLSPENIPEFVKGGKSYNAGPYEHERIQYDETYYSSQKYKVDFSKSGVICKEDNTAQNVIFSSDKLLNFVLSRDGELYINNAKKQKDLGPLNKGNTFSHASFLTTKDGSKQCICAGEIKINTGKIEFINNASGHFKPSTKNLCIAVKMLENFFSTNPIIGAVTSFDEFGDPIFSKYNSVQEFIETTAIPATYSKRPITIRSNDVNVSNSVNVNTSKASQSTLKTLIGNRALINGGRNSEEKNKGRPGSQALFVNTSPGPSCSSANNPPNHKPQRRTLSFDNNQSIFFLPPQQPEYIVNPPLLNPTKPSTPNTNTTLEPSSGSTNTTMSPLVLPRQQTAVTPGMNALNIAKK